MSDGGQGPLAANGQDAGEAKLRRYLEKVTHDLRRAHRRADDLERRAHEPVAIVGIGCRYPGGVGSPLGLWGLLTAGIDAIAEPPSDRGWGASDAEPDIGEGLRLPGGFVEGAAEFDAGFFGISPREARFMDPQERSVLEVSWEALEDAMVDPADLRGSEVGVFTGTMYRDYGGPGAGGTASVVSGRIAYALGLQGPAITVDTACSSSLVAIHLASQALRGGECGLALAGGVTVLATLGVYSFLGPQGGLAPDGRCKAFAEAADGVGVAEGAGILVLERLSDAQANGHPVLATIRGSAVNQDGASNGLTAPNGPSQERVIRQALANARLAPSDVDAVEAHGTGTTLGDPIEAGALLATYGQERDRPLYLGSLKSNIGHTQAAAGVAGVIKAVLAMREGILPKTLHVDAPSSKVDWEAGQIELLTEAREWEANGRPRRAGVSSFGISGTNAHLILEEAPQPAQGSEDRGRAEGGGEAAEPRPLPGPALLPLSAKSEPALAESAARLAAHLRERPELRPADLAYSLATTRSRFSHRAVALAEDREQLLDALAAIAAGESSPRTARGKAGADSRPVFLFPGQGAQWARMGAELLEASPRFVAEVEACEEALSPHVEWSLREVMREGDGEWLDRLDVVQPALFALMVSLARLWQACGVQPAAVAGHSQGEIAAAHIAGGLSLADAARVVALRAAAMARIAGRGGMLSVALPERELAARLEPFGDRMISLAALNGPASQVLSGEPDALAELQAACQADGVRTRQVAVDYAAHSAQIEDLREELLEAFAPISPQGGGIPMHSTLTGEPVDTERLDAAYWYRNLRETVRFEPVLRSLLDGGHRCFVEIGPHPVLGLPAQETIDAALDEPAEATVLGTLRREEGGPERFALSLAEAHAAGAELDFEALFAGTGAKTAPLPTYPFQRKRYWLSSSSEGSDPAAIGQTPLDHPLLGAAIEDPTSERLTLTGRLSLATHPWLADHAVAGAVLLPGTAFLELAFKAAEAVGAQSVAELTVDTPLWLVERQAVQVQVAVGGSGEDGWRELSIHSRPDTGEEERLAGGDRWTCHARGALTVAPVAAPEPLMAWPPSGAESIDIDAAYDRLADSGVDYGSAFQNVTAAWRAGGTLYVEASLPDEHTLDAARGMLHPALLEATLQVASHANGADAFPEGPALPLEWSEAALWKAGSAKIRARLVREERGQGLSLFDESGSIVGVVGLANSKPVDPRQAGGAVSLPLYRVDWTATQSLPSGAAAPPRVAVLGKEEVAGLAAERYASLEALRAAVEQGGEPPEAVLAAVRADRAPGKSSAAAAEGVAAEALELLEAWLEIESLRRSRLVFLTEGALAVVDGDDPELAVAPLAGLLRSAHSEHPGRFGLVDTDGSDASSASLAAALRVEGEDQIALRGGAILVPRLAPTPPASDDSASFAVDPDATVLITGGLSGVGAIVARHLASAHGARRLLLVSRSGPKAEGAAKLRTELEELGATVTVAACDVADREQLAQLIGAIPARHPLGAVFHSAAVLDDGVLESLDRERLERVMRPKAGAAWHLHELTRDCDLSHFVVFSSAAGVLGGAGQANYSAANAFVDALAQHRRRNGLAAVSLAWGLWGQISQAMADELEPQDLRRFGEQVRARLGFSPMPPEQGLELLDRAWGSAEPLLVPAAFDGAALRAQARSGTLPAVMRGLVRTPVRRPSETGSLGSRLKAMPAGERGDAVLELVRSEVATVLGHSSPLDVEPRRSFREQGLDSLGAVELRNRLNAVTGMQLPTTIVFDRPSVLDLAEFLCAELQGKGRDAEIAVRTPNGDEPIAVIGMGCRYPGGVGSPQELWELVASGEDAIGTFPDDRGWDLERLYHPDPEYLGTCYAREGGFLDTAFEFDPEFFEISPREAIALEPQQRALLEVAWETLEGAGIDPHSIRGSKTGVFAGVGGSDYALSFLGRKELEEYMVIGLASNVASGRIAYTLGLTGPAISVDTACSSSLVAVHLATQALRRGECSMALAGGATILSTPSAFICGSRQRGLAPDGRCKSFSEAADGAGFSEGVGMVLLQRLSDAQRDDHQVLATIRGSAINQDGASNGLAAPSGRAQEQVILEALADADLPPGAVDAVEAHGTGTVLGDPIEAGALLAAYGRDRDEPLRLGSLKSNIGHAQSAAGVAGLIKMVLALREGTLPKTLHVDAPSSKIDWSAGRVELLTEAARWERNGRTRRAGISAFGVSGTNAHVILEEPPVSVEEEAGGGEHDLAAEAIPGDCVPLVLYARSDPALREAAGRLALHLDQNPDLESIDVASSLVTSRPAFEHRALVVPGDRTRCVESLAAFSEGGTDDRVVSGVAREERRPVFVFPGHGAQWAGMASALLESSPAFAGELRNCQEALEPHLDWRFEDVLHGAEDAMPPDRPDIVQPMLFAATVSLAALWRSAGVEPAAVVGQSQGEIAAAYVAGGLSLDDAARVVALRSKVMLGLEGTGRMVSVALPLDRLEQALEPWKGRIEIAGLIGPSAAVLSGDDDAVDELMQWCEQSGTRAREIPGAVGASHSAHVETLRNDVLAALGPIDPRSGEVTFHSTVVGGTVDTSSLDAEYWYRNIRQPVLLEPVTRALLERGQGLFVEVSPHPVLRLALEGTIEAASEPGDAAALGTLRRGDGGPDRFALSLAEAHARGVRVDWKALLAGTGARRVPLPTYPFQRKRFMLGSALGAGGATAAGLLDADHPLLGAVVEDPVEGGIALTGRIGLDSHPWLADHAVGGVALFPGTAFLEMALCAAERVSADVVKELVLLAPLTVPAGGAVQLRVSLGEVDEGGERPLSIHARPQPDPDEEPEGWTCHAQGTVGSGQPQPSAGIGDWPPAGAVELEVGDLYERLAESGLAYGSTFRGLSRAWEGDGAVFAEVSLPESRREEGRRFALHPALLDAALHSVALRKLSHDGLEGAAILPFSWRDVSLQVAGATELRARIELGEGEGEEEAALAMADPSGLAVAAVGSLRVRPLDSGEAIAADRAAEEILALEWVDAGGDARDAGGEPTRDAPVRLASLGPTGLPGIERHASIESLCASLGDGGEAPQAVIWEPPLDRGGGVPDCALAVAQEGLRTIQAWLAERRLDGLRLVVVTRRAVATAEGASPDLRSAPLWGLVRCAQSEHPGRFSLIDLDDSEASSEALPAALALDQEPQLALRDGTALAPRLAPVRELSDWLVPPSEPWALECAGDGTLDSLSLAPSRRARESLGPAEVRISMRAAGLSFHDVIAALGVTPSAGSIVGAEGAGVVVEVGDEVRDLSPGDRVMGTVPAAFGPLAVSSRELVVPLPEAWSFEQGAAMPSAFITAYFALRDLADLRPGEKVLIHAAAGGVGMAAVQIARHLGAEVFATASEGKWEALERAGIEPSHIASSRDARFKDRFIAETAGEGVDVVLNSLAGELTDASLELLPRGGRFIELGKTDIRDAETLAAARPGVEYRPVVLLEAGGERLQEMFAEVLSLFEAGALRHSPISTWDVRQAPAAFRRVREGRNVGRAVLQIPRPMDPESTVLITGGTGELGRVVARHLVAEHGARNLLLVSRRGEAAPGAEDLGAELTELGAQVRIAACDVSDRRQLQQLLESIPEEHPLGAVIHAASTWADGTVEGLAGEQFEHVFGPKLDAAWHLHELTEDMDLSAFVLFSSVAGVLGNPGQSNYAAANVFLDALAAHRRAAGLAATSIAWGVWAESRGAELAPGDGDIRVGRWGVLAFRNERGLALFDAALASAPAQAAAVAFDRAELRALASSGSLPAVLRRLVRARARRRLVKASLAARLAAMPDAERRGYVLDLVRREVEAMVGDTAGDLAEETPFKELGFDSLAAVELRNRVNAATGLSLPASVMFDCPTPGRLTEYLLSEAAPESAGSGGAQASVDDPFAQAAGFGSAEFRGAIRPLVQRAFRRVEAEELIRLLMAFAPFRASFDRPLGYDEAPTPVRLAEGSAGIPLFCFATATFTSGPQEYTAFASEFDGIREVTVLPHSGFAPGEPLPADLAVAIETQAEAVLRLAGDRPFVLVGHSTAGLFANSVAARLEEMGAGPAGVVAIDTYRTDVGVSPEVLKPFADATVAIQGDEEVVSTTRLTAMGGYWRLFLEWRLRDVAAPQLLLRAGEPVTGVAADADWRCTWGLDDEIEVPGNHFDLMQPGHAGTTARALDAWLSAQSADEAGEPAAVPAEAH